FKSVIDWVQVVFPNYRKEMKGIPWGKLYNEYKNTPFDTARLEEQIKTLMADDDVSNKKGIYEYVLTGEERCLNIRAFTDSMKRSAFERQNGICPKCKKTFEIEQMEGDHITPWHEGGKTTPDNCQMLCKDCNRRKSGK
ncbi:MAG: HNH endonuclease, partial [Planctomycetaceae bacterium]|nr:HNH endonuclease [Planctomycetaceae bacterium]